MDITQLAKRIQDAKDAYYNGNPLMDDATFDSLEDQLRAIDPNHPVLARVGAAVPPSTGGGAWLEVKHTIPMGSLNKAQTAAEMASWYQGIGVNPLVVMDKLDGASLCCEYRQRKFHQAVTRGDGITGQDITRNVALMQGVIKMLPPALPDGTPTPDRVFIRGEIITKKSDHKAYFPGESNPRNTASGTSKRQSDNSKCQYLTFVAYQLLPNGVGLDTKSAELYSLRTMGFQTPVWSQAANLASVEVTYLNYVSAFRASLDYDIDGLVVEVDDRDVREALGDLNGRPKGANAYKFPHEKKPTKLIDVEWQVGKSGRITPVAIFEPVILAGAEVRRASLAGVRQVELLKLYKGCTIMVARRNDVIPRVEANLSEGIEND